MVASLKVTELPKKVFFFLICYILDCYFINTKNKKAFPESVPLKF